MYRTGICVAPPADTEAPMTSSHYSGLLAAAVISAVLLLILLFAAAYLIYSRVAPSKTVTSTPAVSVKYSHSSGQCRLNITTYNEQDTSAACSGSGKGTNAFYFCQPFSCCKCNCRQRVPGRRALRCAVTDRLAVPSVRLHTVGNRAFPVAAPKVWNSLLDDIVSSASLSTFCRLLKTFLFRVSVSDLILSSLFSLLCNLTLSSLISSHSYLSHYKTIITLHYIINAYYCIRQSRFLFVCLSVTRAGCEWLSNTGSKVNNHLFTYPPYKRCK